MNAPDEQAVLDWAKLRLATLHALSEVEAINLIVTRYPDGTINGHWVLHRARACAIEPTIADGVRTLREKLEARP
jgi:hypothetical protein